MSPRISKAMTAVGHEDSFPRPGQNGRCRFGQATFAGTHLSGQDAPIPDLPVHALDRRGSHLKAVKRPVG